MQPLQNRSVLVILLACLVLVILLHEPHGAFPEFKAMSKAAAGIFQLNLCRSQVSGGYSVIVIEHRCASVLKLGLSHSSWSPLNTAKN